MGKVVLPKGAAAPVLGLAPRRQDRSVTPSQAAEATPPADLPDLRLMIEESEEAGGFVYVIVDRKTGKVVSRLSREEVLRLKEKSNYAAGAVFNGKA